jgi:hypothetical protein
MSAGLTSTPTRKETWNGRLGNDTLQRRMETINVHGLPESIARALEAIVNTLRQQSQIKKQHKQAAQAAGLGRKTLGEIDQRRDLRRCHVNSPSWTPTCSLTVSTGIPITTGQHDLCSTKQRTMRMLGFVSLLRCLLNFMRSLHIPSGFHIPNCPAKLWKLSTSS